MTRKILHLDLDAFFCAVEERRDPALRRKPFAVGGRPETRGVVASCSYAARRYGVRSAMPMARAIRLCPSLLVIPGNHKLYAMASREVMDIVNNYSGLVEQISIDEAFIDISDIREPGEVIARRLQAEIHSRLSLPCSVGVAGNKLVAKIANDVGKSAARDSSPPNAITIVPAGREAEFLAPLPVESLWGVGPRTQGRLEKLGVKTIGDLAQLPTSELTRLMGRFAAEIQKRARGIDHRPVTPHHDAKSISHENTFAQDINDPVVLRRKLRKLSAGVGRRLRKKNLSGNIVRLKVRWSDFTTLTRQTTLSDPINQDQLIFQAVFDLFREVWDPPRLIRLLGVGVSGLRPPIRQLSLWDDAYHKETHLQEAIDKLKDRFGDDIIQRGRL